MQDTKKNTSYQTKNFNKEERRIEISNNDQRFNDLTARVQYLEEQLKIGQNSEVITANHSGKFSLIIYLFLLKGSESVKVIRDKIWQFELGRWKQFLIAQLKNVVLHCI